MFKTDPFIGAMRAMTMRSKAMFNTSTLNVARGAAAKFSTAAFKAVLSDHGSALRVAADGIRRRIKLNSPC
jgi:hypothetical protein